MFNNIITSVRRFFKIGEALDRSLAKEADEKDKCLYVSQENVTKLQNAVANLNNIVQEKKEAAEKIKTLDAELKKIAVQIAVETDKAAKGKNFANIGSLIQKGVAIVAAIMAGGFVLSEVVMALVDSYKSAEKEKVFNEKFYERLLAEEYDERQYIISLLEDKKKQKEIEASQVISTVILPSPPPPMYMKPPHPAPRPVSPPVSPKPVNPEKPTPEPEPETEPEVEEITIPEGIEEPVIEEPIESVSVEETPNIGSLQELSPSIGVSMVDNTKGEASPNINTDLEPPPTPNIYGAPPKMDFSRNYSIFKSSITDKALKALGLEKPMALIGTTVVTTILIHHIEEALNEIHDLVVQRLANGGKS